MTDSSIIDLLGGTAAVARRIGATMASVSEWRRSGIPEGRRIALAAEIESSGGPSRRTMFPNDWHRIWPELIGADGAPAVQSAAEASDAG